MGKRADKYFLTDPWRIIEEGFHKDYSKVGESIFSLGNEYMGIRGYFEEGYSGKTLIGSYFNGVFESEKLSKSGYKGMISESEFMVNAVNWLASSIWADGERLDLNVSTFTDFTRVLDMKTGLLTRKFIWVTHTEKQIEVTFERFLSMVHENMGVQKISVLPLNGDLNIEINIESDFGGFHTSRNKNYWNIVNKESEANWMKIEGETLNTKKYLASCSYVHCSPACSMESYTDDKKVGKKIVIHGKQGQLEDIIKVVCNDREGDKDLQAIISAYSNPNAKGSDLSETMVIDYDNLIMENEAWWRNIWEKSDIQIIGDEENQQGIRFCIFQMFQTYHGAKEGNNIGAKGLTGESYNGNAFWDTETYCLPFFLFNHEKAAKNLLMFRYQTLPEAQKRARELDCQGAFYPIATISGKECCDLWQHASLQLQASTGVAYGIWLYDSINGDKEFLYHEGIEMLIEISRMLATRGDWSADGKEYGYYCVMGPDEFQMMVNHNYYTNAMGQFTFQYTYKVLEALRLEDASAYRKVLQENHLTQEEREDWNQKALHMYLPYQEESQLFEQHEGYFRLPHIDVKKIPQEDFPLYHHWSYDRIYRNDMIKQPDVLMMMLLFNQSYTENQIQANYEFYEPRCIHESSLSPSVHSILASQLKKKEEAYEFFRFATRMDLDNYNRNTREGLHTTSIAAAWMNIIYGFGGMRSDSEILTFNPSIPKAWESFSFRINYHHAVIVIEVFQEEIQIRLMEEGQIPLRIYNQDYTITNNVTNISIPIEWR